MIFCFVREAGMSIAQERIQKYAIFVLIDENARFTENLR